MSDKPKYKILVLDDQYRPVLEGWTDQINVESINIANPRRQPFGDYKMSIAKYVYDLKMRLLSSDFAEENEVFKMWRYDD